MKESCKPFLVAFVLSSLAGVPLHFLYDLTKFPLFALIAPVNESVWEHIKLSVVPLLIVFVLFSIRKTVSSSLVCPACAAILSSVFLIIGGHYLLVCGFGLESVVLDILLYFASMAGAYLIACRFLRCPCSNVTAYLLQTMTLLLFVMIVVFTFFPPTLPLFTE